jgi:CMP/dCMP kinase
MSPIAVAVDGPAGSGKSSVSREVARRLGFDFVDTGSFYRAVAWLASDREALDGDLDDFLRGVVFDVSLDPDLERISIDGYDVTSTIRSPGVSAAVSTVARVPRIRADLNDIFRGYIDAATTGIVLEGRDITTVVAPDAPVRILLTADEDVRIARRSKDLPAEQAGTAGQLRERDRKDSQVVDFMTPAPGVTVVDSTHLDFEQTVRRVIELVEAS